MIYSNYAMSRYTYVKKQIFLIAAIRLINDFEREVGNLIIRCYN